MFGTVTLPLPLFLWRPANPYKGAQQDGCIFPSPTIPHHRNVYPFAGIGLVLEDHRYPRPCFALNPSNRRGHCSPSAAQTNDTFCRQRFLSTACDIAFPAATQAACDLKTAVDIDEEVPGASIVLVTLIIKIQFITLSLLKLVGRAGLSCCHLARMLDCTVAYIPNMARPCRRPVNYSTFTITHFRSGTK